MPSPYNGTALTTGFWSEEKLWSGLQSALTAKWAIGSGVIGGLLMQAFTSGQFATPESTLAYFKVEWWTLLVSFVFGTAVGGGIRAQNKIGYVNAVETGSAPPPSTLPVVSPLTPPTNPTTEPPPVTKP